MRNQSLAIVAFVLATSGLTHADPIEGSWSILGYQEGYLKSGKQTLPVANTFTETVEFHPGGISEIGPLAGLWQLKGASYSANYSTAYKALVQASEPTAKKVKAKYRLKGMALDANLLTGKRALRFTAVVQGKKLKLKLNGTFAADPA